MAPMRRLSMAQRRKEIKDSTALQNVVISETTSRVRAICVAAKHVNKEYLQSLVTWKTILDKCREFKEKSKDECASEKDWELEYLGYFCNSGHSLLSASLLVLACTTGAMNNHFATAVHKDVNSSHPVETLSYHARINTCPTREADCKAILLQQPLGYLFLADARILTAMRPGFHVMNCSLREVRHAADDSRNHSNWSCVCGPR